MPNNEEQGKAEHTPETALESGGKRSKCGKGGNQTSDVAFSTILYVGTSRDYEYFVATRVMIQSLLHTGTDADVVVLASEGVPQDWTATL